MRAWDSVTRGVSLRPGPAAFAILLAGLLLSLAPVSQRLEWAYYDLLQQLNGGPGSRQIVLVDTRSIDKVRGPVWESSRFPDLLIALGAAGARTVVTIEAPPMTTALPDSVQLATLAEIERRSRHGDGGADTSGDGSRGDDFSRQLAEMRRRSELQARTVQAVAALRNVLVAVPTFDGVRNATTPNSECLRHSFDMGAPADVDGTAGVRRVRAVVAPPAHLCEVVAGAGHVEFWPDADGVVRRVDLLVNASGALVPSAALRAALAADPPTDRMPQVMDRRISWNGHDVPMTDGLAALLRFYSAGTNGSAFDIVSGAELLRGAVSPKRIAGRFVIVGDTVAGAADPGYVTPVAKRMSSAAVLATALSNLLESDFLARPAWLSWVESLVLICVGVLVLTWGARLPPALALMVGILLAALLLALEAWLVLRSGVWPRLSTAAAFTLFSMVAIRFLQPGGERRQEGGLVAMAAAAGGPQVRASANVTVEDELDLAFSMLRHQPPSPHVKQRLYDVALEHARRRDLAKAERVLRHLAGIDPDFRHAGEKLKKLAGLRNSVPDGAAPATKQVPTVAQAAPELATLTGRSIGRYQIEQPIGRGAMATVYLGRDPKINRRVAIKTIALAEEFSDNDLVNARTQFLREAESAGRLNHPNIISIYDAGEDGEVAYLAMEYFPGKALSYYAQQAQLLPPRLVFELMARAAEALHYAHGQHVVHRDVKPANLLYDSGTDTLKITDFGIARLTDTSRTKTGIILGTPSYMSPEQLAGTNVTGQSDLFSLGITLYQLLTGVPPFRADSIPRLMQKIAHERHESVSALRDDLPACVDELLDRALAKDPVDRFASGRAMALALRDCCSSFDVGAAVQSS